MMLLGGFAFSRMVKWLDIYTGYNNGTTSSGTHCLMACQITRSGKLSGFQLFKRVRLPDLLPWEEGFGEGGFKFVDV